MGLDRTFKETTGREGGDRVFGIAVARCMGQSQEEVCVNSVDPRAHGGLLPEVVPQGVRILLDLNYGSKNVHAGHEYSYFGSRVRCALSGESGWLLAPILEGYSRTIGGVLPGVLGENILTQPPHLNKRQDVS